MAVRPAALRPVRLHASAQALARRLLAAVAAFGLVTAVAAHGEGAPGGQAPAGASHAPAPIAMSDILARADEDLRLVERVESRRTLPESVDRLERELDALSRLVDDKLHLLNAQELRRLPVIRLESLARQWAFEGHRLERWQAAMREAFAPTVDAATQLALHRAEWQATRSAPAAEVLPRVLADRVDTMIAKLAVAESALTEPLSRQLELSQRANVVDSRIRSGSADVAAAIAYIDGRLLHLDAPPLWDARPSTAASGVALIAQGVEVEAQFAQEYHAETGRKAALAALQGVLLLALLSLWLAARHRALAVPADGSAALDEASARVLSRPVSAWLLLAMMAALAFSTGAPLLAQELAMAIALVPMLRLLPPRSVETLGIHACVAIAGLYVLDRMGFVLMASGYLYRVFLLGLAALALLLSFWLLRRLARLPRTPRLGWLPAAVRLAAVAAAVLLAMACVSNLVGNVSLAEMLTAGVIDSSYFALLLHAGVAVGITLLKLLLKLPSIAGRRLVRTHGATAVQFAARLLRLAAAAGWAAFAMDAFRILRPINMAVAGMLSYTFEVGEISLSPGDVLIFAISVLISLAAARVTRLVLREHLLGREWLSRGAGNSVASLTYYAVLVLGFLLALSAAGFKVGQLAIVFGALGVGVGFGLQNVVGNFVAGLVLMFERPIQPGDLIEIPGVSGEVRDIGLRATVIRTFDGADVVVPNGTLTAANLTNWTLYDNHRRIEVEVGVAYGSDPVQLIGLLEGVARQTPGVADTPAPSALLTGYGDSALNFALRAWTNDATRWGAIRSDLRTRILQALRRRHRDPVQPARPEPARRLRGGRQPAAAVRACG